MSVNKILVNNLDSNYTHSIFDISEYTGISYDTLSDALDAIPQAKRKGGMTIRYVPTNDHKYVQYRLMADEWSSSQADWQGVDVIPVLDSHNLIESGGIAKILGIPKQLGVSTIATSIPYEIVNGKQYLFKNNSSESYVQIRLSNTQGDSGTVITNLNAGKQYLYTANDDYIYIRAVLNANNTASNYEVYAVEDIIGNQIVIGDRISDAETAIDKNNVGISLLEVIESGGLQTSNGKPIAYQSRLRTVDYLYPDFEITVPNGFQIYYVFYYDKTTGAFITYKSVLNTKYTILDSITSGGTTYTNLKAKVVFSKTNTSSNITADELKKNLVLENLYSSIQEKGTQISAIISKIDTINTEIENIQTAENNTAAPKNFAYEFKKGTKYIIKNVSEHGEDFAVYMRVTSGGDNITISTQLRQGVSVEFTPSVDGHYIRLSAPSTTQVVEQKVGIVQITDTSTINGRLNELEKSSGENSSAINDINAKLKSPKHINIGDISYLIRECAGVNMGTTPPPVYVEQVYDALMAEHQGYITKIDCKTDSGIEVPSYYSNTIMVGGSPLTLPFPMYHFKPISYDDNSLVKIFITGGVHGEAVGVNALYWFCKKLAEEADNELKVLKYGIDLYVMPYCNPSTPYITQREYEYEGQTMHPDSTGRLNWNLVNINRNMPYSDWVLTPQYITEGAREGQPYSDYSGPSAGSEYESQLIVHYAEQIQPDIYIDCHNSAYTGTSADGFNCFVWVLRNNITDEIGRITSKVCSDIAPLMSKAVQADDTTNYPQAEMTKLIYINSESRVRMATINNYMSETYNIPSYTTEGIQMMPYEDQTLIPVADRTNNTGLACFTEYQEMSIEAVIKRTIKELYL